MVSYRVEKDFLGEVKIPENAYWDKRTQRFNDNYHISDSYYPDLFIQIGAEVKKAAAQANLSAGLLNKDIADMIIKATERIINGEFHNQFIVDPYSPNTAFNMNLNEVIANIANEGFNSRKGLNDPVHPNDHVNRGQSTVDVLPTVMNLVFIHESRMLLENIDILLESISNKAYEFMDIVKVGRTHLMDGHPIKLGQEFSKYFNWVYKDKVRIENAIEKLKMVRIGTNIGTALNLNTVYRRNVINILSKNLGIDLSGFEDTVNSDDTSDYLELSSSLRSLSIDLKRFANDIRFMNSGPFAGIGEIEIPATEPGSSFFPGKVNPGVPESVIRVALQVIAIDTAVDLICQNGEMDANIFISIIAIDIYHAMKILTNACTIFSVECIDGIKANKERIHEMTKKSLGFAVVLSPYIGYDKATILAREIKEQGKSIKEILDEARITDETTRNEILSIFGMI